jgi:predicted Fe-S protein YdhL (DUF1289 family)
MKKLSFRKKWKQILKGIFDSPCVEVCTYKKGDSYCKACGLSRIEKKSWKNSNKIQKQSILEQTKLRLLN